DLGGAPREQLDAFKLLGAFLQHTDSKPQQQRLMCLDKKEERQAEGPSTCEQPFMMINDLGLTFGHTSVLNWNKPSSVNLENWAKTPIWLHNTGCEAKLKKSASGTLFDPYISEGGRVFLLNLLTQLSDQQLADLFK